MRDHRRAVLRAFVFLATLALCGQSWAGDIAGSVTVAKPAHAVVYLEKVPGAFPPGHATMDQVQKVFVPYVLPVVQGTVVTFHNSDNLQHNVFGVGADEFNMGTYGLGASHEHVFSKLGEADILCNVHSEMQAFILVLQNPYFAQPDSSGKFQLANVPAGDYVLKLWYEGHSKKQNIKVPASGAVSANF